MHPNYTSLVSECRIYVLWKQRRESEMVLNSSDAYLIRMRRDGGQGLLRDLLGPKACGRGCRQDCAGEKVEGGSGWGGVGLGAGVGVGAGGAMREVTNFLSSRSSSPGPFPPKAQSQAQGSQSRMRFNSLNSGMLFNPMSAAPASSFTSFLFTSSSTSPFTSTSSANRYLPRSGSSATATAMSTRPSAPFKVVPMPTEEDEENMEVARFANGMHGLSGDYEFHLPL
ncbi:hypothetical protein CVT25_014363 [Psilocybe cyanescens]|uniref:Uncharacterized protein n=1 Tax=Psilocybe cyanescens TaxID=93625 RepID=A0A409XPJ4_PSICY|nr:hypothetical protein CVT25_014363 [Psilocybe cyanescens]